MKLTLTEFVSSQKSTSQSPKRDENKQIFIMSEYYETFSANYLILKCIFRQCFNCKTNGKINNFTAFTFSIVMLTEKQQFRRH